jgi:hypothetical protein
VRSITVGPAAVLQDSDDAGLADAGGDLEAQRLQPRSQRRRRALLLEGELGVLVQVDVELLDIGVDGVDLGRAATLGGGAGGRQKRRERHGDIEWFIEDPRSWFVRTRSCRLNLAPGSPARARAGRGRRCGARS